MAGWDKGGMRNAGGPRNIALDVGASVFKRSGPRRALLQRSSSSSAAAVVRLLRVDDGAKQRPERLTTGR